MAVFQYIRKLLRQNQRLEEQVRSSQTQDPVPEQTSDISEDLAKNAEEIKKIYSVSSDIIYRDLLVGREGERKALLFFVDGMCNMETIQEHIIRPLMLLAHGNSSIDMIEKSVLTAGETKRLQTMYEIVNAALTGDAVLLVDGHSVGLSISAKGWQSRSVSEPDTETTVRGPREGYTENMRTNTALLRRKIQNPDLKIETVEVGVRTRTKVCIAYIDSIVNPALVKETKKRLAKIHTDAILSAGYIEEYIEDAPSSIFQTVAITEKPDVTAAKLLEGRLAIMVDGTPFVLTVPMLFIENFHTAEDYSQRRYFASFLRIMRLMAFIISVLGPALYVAFTTYHQELIPTSLLFTMAAASEGVPFPAALETMIMLITYEILREAGVRLPKPVGSAVSIVGALVMGQAAVQAGLVGAPVVIIIAFTAVASFVSPQVNEAAALLRWILLILATVMGGFGITMGVLGVLTHLATLKSFSTPYLSPIAPLQAADLKDTLIRVPLWKMKTRPVSLKPQDLVRQDPQGPYEQPDTSDNQQGGGEENEE